MSQREDRNSLAIWFVDLYAKRKTCMRRERSAPLDQAARCRRTAEETILPDVAERLRTMASQYEARAAELIEQEQSREVQK
jgi:hypothetical protein